MVLIMTETLLWPGWFGGWEEEWQDVGGEGGISSEVLSLKKRKKGVSASGMFLFISLFHLKFLPTI